MEWLREKGRKVMPSLTVAERDQGVKAKFSMTVLEVEW
jgi:hypothetical protein